MHGDLGDLSSILRPATMRRRKPLKRKARINPIRSRTRQRNDYYHLLRRLWLPRHCFMSLDCSATATDVHHIHGRARIHMLNVETWAAMCRPHHQWVTEHPEDARELGLCRSSWEMPEPMRQIIDHCRSCDAAIVWAITENGKSIPLQASPDGEPLLFFGGGSSAGRIVKVSEEPDLFGQTVRLNVRVLTDSESCSGGFWLTHFVDCPDSEEWRSEYA